MKSIKTHSLVLAVLLPAFDCFALDTYTPSIRRVSQVQAHARQVIQQYSNHKLASYGVLDVTIPPYSADNTGQTDVNQLLEVEVDASGLPPRIYSAIVSVKCRKAINSPQAFRVQLRVPETAPQSDVTINDRDLGFYAAPYFWVGHRFCRCPVDRRGYNGFYITNGGRALEGEFVRFSPDLQEGRYTVSFPDETPFSPGVAFNVRVRDRNGEHKLKIWPMLSRMIRIFDFYQGTDGFVEIQAGDSDGLVIADAVRFRRGS